MSVGQGKVREGVGAGEGRGLPNPTSSMTKQGQDLPPAPCPVAGPENRQSLRQGWCINTRAPSSEVEAHGWPWGQSPTILNPVS